ncbi:MAG: double zinc ribbon domain-containing protein [Paracoccaceae bacterium]
MTVQVRGLREGLQSALRLAFPPRCLTCDASVTDDFGLCASCWRETPFISGLVCDLCGSPLPGDDTGRSEHCDDCLTIARPWVKGRAALLYRGNARDLVLSLKHSDRLDLAPSAAKWLYRAAAPLVEPGTVVAPVPLHWLRLLRRKYNQSAELSRPLARLAKADHCPDLLQRIRNTGTQDGRTRDGRFVNTEGAIRVDPRRCAGILGRPVLLVDDVMTSGATFAAAAEACLAAGASLVSVVALARVTKDA